MCAQLDIVVANCERGLDSSRWTIGTSGTSFGAANELWIGDGSGGFSEVTSGYIVSAYAYSTEHGANPYCSINVRLVDVRALIWTPRGLWVHPGLRAPTQALKAMGRPSPTHLQANGDGDLDVHFANSYMTDVSANHIYFSQIEGQPYSTEVPELYTNNGGSTAN